MHFGLNDIDRTRAGIVDARCAGAFDVMHGGGGADHGIQNAFGDFLIIAIENGWVTHQVADISDKKQGAAMQHKFVDTTCLGVFAIRVQAARKCFTALADFLGKCALQNAEPIAIGQHFIFGVHNCDGIFQIENG